jgi:hypothetical protein
MLSDEKQTSENLRVNWKNNLTYETRNRLQITWSIAAEE